MRIVLCSPLSEEKPAFRQSFDDLKMVLSTQHEVFTAHTYGVSGICKVRNDLVKKAMAYEPDYLFWVDDDMMFGNDIVERLLSHKKEFVCAEMFTKTVPFKPSLKRATGEGGLDFTNYVAYPEDSLFEIGGCGFAATLVHRRLFEDLRRVDDVSGEYWFKDNEFCGESEDMNFCIRARQKGHKLWCDSSVTTRHIGGMGIGRENWLYWKNRPGAKVF